MLGPFVNLNGTSREELIKQAFDVASAAETLIQALGRAAPHGRDYQTVSQQYYKRDRELWERFVRYANDTFTEYRNNGERLFTEGETRKRGG